MLEAGTSLKGGCFDRSVADAKILALSTCPAVKAKQEKV